jgi:hypothetical protein
MFQKKGGKSPAYKTPIATTQSGGDYAVAVVTMEMV